MEALYLFIGLSRYVTRTKYCSLGKRVCNKDKFKEKRIFLALQIVYEGVNRLLRLFLHLYGVADDENSSQHKGGVAVE